MDKKWRLDLQQWEVKLKFLFIPYYKYTVFGKKATYTLFRKKNPEYFKFRKTPFTKEEIDSFHNNKI